MRLIDFNTVQYIVPRYIEDIYFFGVNTNIFHSERYKTPSIFHECASRLKMLIFSSNERKYIWYSPKKGKFSFYFILNGKYRKHNLTFFPGRYSYDLTFSVCLVTIALDINKVCT